MIIKGFIDTTFNPPAPVIKAFIQIEKPRIKGYIKFLIDTGASSTAILDKDREFLGIDLDEMEKSPIEISGIGGTVNTYLARKAKLIFKTEDGEHTEIIDILILKHDLSKMPKELSKKILAMPSPLGRDIINKYTLQYNYNSKEIYLPYNHS